VENRTEGQTEKKNDGRKPNSIDDYIILNVNGATLPPKKGQKL